MLALVAPVLLFATVQGSHAYIESVEKWRAAREERLKAPNGWLSLVGLSWLKPGANTVGTSDSDRVVLPKHDFYPAEVGTITVQGSSIHFDAKPGVKAMLDGKPATSGELKPDVTGSPTTVSLGPVNFFIIKRADKLGVRIKDPEADTRVHFTGLQWFPVKEQWKITAKWVPFEKRQKLVMDSVIGEKEEAESDGYAVFTINGHEYKLQPSTEDKQLFFVFRDTTAGKSTYPAARFLYSEAPVNGTVTLDFNKAYNPPCAFTPYATCPLPIPTNRLPIPIEAGEKMYGKGHH